MTPYGDRRRKGEYDVGAVKTTKQDTVHDPATGGTTVQEQYRPQLDPTELTLKELQAQAEAPGSPATAPRPRSLSGSPRQAK